jgi:transposase-like protein
MPQNVYPNPEQECIERDAGERFIRRILGVVREMSPAQRRIVVQALKSAGKPLSVVAHEVGVTRERVRQVMNEFRERVLGARPEKTGPGRKRWREAG